MATGNKARMLSFHSLYHKHQPIGYNKTKHLSLACALINRVIKIKTKAEVTSVAAVTKQSLRLGLGF